ncbi:hypothetical protein LZC95_08050 [Pendulispora brunnea]|uniref:Uncharacterized protein n=1 Tax=Pendulispora brunnea TaxID=2905690 RepID=A0ABZ2KGW4_9BACT
MIVLPPSAFADRWEAKPDAAVAVGLRLLSERDIQVAKAESSKWVDKMYSGADGVIRDVDKAVESWNDCLVRWACALGTCDPNDVTKPYFPAAEDVIGDALTSEGLRRIWDALELLHLEESPVAPEATDAEILALIGRIAEGTADVAESEGRAIDAGPLLTGLSLAQAKRARRLFGRLGELV